MNQVATPVQARGMRDIIFAQIFAGLTYTSFHNGFLILYCIKLQAPAALTVTLISLPWLILAVCNTPLAYLADRSGKRRMAILGSLGEAVGFGLITASGFLPAEWSSTGLAIGIAVYALGLSAFNAVWFAMLSPLVPVPVRGRFFGRMRLTWQSVSFVFGLSITWYLTADSPMAVFQIVLLALTIAQVIHALMFLRVPELERPQPQRYGLLESIARVVRVEGYASFCCYIFLLSVCTANCPKLFSLTQKNVYLYGDDDVMWMSNLYMGGAIAGFFLGGKLVDRLGTKPVFLYAHFAYAGVLFAVLLRESLPVSVYVSFSVLSALYGLIWSASTIAVSTEMLALIPPENKSLSTAVCVSLSMLGVSCSGFLDAAGLDLGLLSEQWTFAGQSMGVYDALLLLHAVAVLLLVVSLGLVPSVLRKAEWMPKGD